MGSGTTSTRPLMGHMMCYAKLANTVEIIGRQYCIVPPRNIHTLTQPSRYHLKFNCWWWWQLQWSSGRHCQGHSFLPASVKEFGWRDLVGILPVIAVLPIVEGSCCCVARRLQPVRPPGCEHHLSLSALGPGSFWQLMVHWVLPNNLLDQRWLLLPLWLKGLTTTTRLLLDTTCRMVWKKNSQIKGGQRTKLVRKRKKKYWFAHWRTVCMSAGIDLQPDCF